MKYGAGKHFIADDLQEARVTSLGLVLHYGIWCRAMCIQGVYEVEQFLAKHNEFVRRFGP
jgi:hypothetical protein